MGLVFGALVGGVAGLLLAPKSGRENRRVVQEKINEVRERINRINRNRSCHPSEAKETLSTSDTDYLH
jgi:gas vesicle protein